MKKILIAAVILAAIAVIASAALQRESYSNMPLQAEAEKHIRYLASDELMGRDTGTPGNDAAARYIAEYFENLGLRYAPGMDSYFQEIPFQRSTHASSGEVQVLGQSFVQDEGMVLLRGQAADLSAPSVFVGYGVDDETKPTFTEQEVAGKIVFARYGQPGARGFRAPLRASKVKYHAAQDGGAAAFVEFYSGPFPWRRIANFLGRSRIEVADPNLKERIPHFLADDNGAILLQKLRSGSVPNASVKTSGAPAEILTSSNVIAVLPGSDPQRKDEFIGLSAHYDHVGASMRYSWASEADSIFNGARDNAFGTVSVMLAARELAKNPPARSVLFMAFTAEEKGLLGSQYFVEHSPMPLNQIVYVLNTDGAGYTDTTITVVAGLERTTAEPYFAQAAATAGLKVIGDPVPEQNLFRRSDNYNFAVKGIPSPTLSPGFRDFDEELRAKYHRPEDEVDEAFSFSYFSRFIQTYTECARLLANADERPRWQAGDEFEEVARKLYGAK